ncbi:MAG: response regulator [Planctomycetota bacterium]
MPEQAPTVLVIDNDLGVVTAISTRLEHLGYCCLTAGTGAQGLAAFREHDVDLVITDLNMPAGDGVTLARTIRKTSGAPILIVTGFQAEYRDALRGLPNVTLVRKPFDSNQLVELVEADLILSGRRLPAA